MASDQGDVRVRCRTGSDVLTIKWDQWGIRNGDISEAFVRIWFGNT